MRPTKALCTKQFPKNTTYSSKQSNVSCRPLISNTRCSRSYSREKLRSWSLKSTNGETVQPCALRVNFDALPLLPLLPLGAGAPAVRTSVTSLEYKIFSSLSLKSGTNQAEQVRHSPSSSSSWAIFTASSLLPSRRSNACSFTAAARDWANQRDTEENGAGRGLGDTQTN